MEPVENIVVVSDKYPRKRLRRRRDHHESHRCHHRGQAQNHREHLLGRPHVDHHEMVPNLHARHCGSPHGSHRVGSHLCLSRSWFWVDERLGGWKTYTTRQQHQTAWVSIRMTNTEKYVYQFILGRSSKRRVKLVSILAKVVGRVWTPRWIHADRITRHLYQPRNQCIHGFMSFK